MKVVDGLLNAKRPKPASPKPSPDGFQWPNQRDAGPEEAEKIGASLQELLPAKGWKHTDLARELWGTAGAHDGPRNTGTARRWVMGELPIPNEESAGYIAQVLDVSMARLLKPTGKFNAKPDMIRERSPNGVNLWKEGKRKKGKLIKAKPAKAAKTPSGRDRAKQRAYNAAYRAKKKAEKEGKPKRKYTKRAVNGHDTGAQSWILADGVDPPQYTIKSAIDGPPGHVSFTLDAVIPHERAMSILHMLQTAENEQEG